MIPLFGRWKQRRSGVQGYLLLNREFKTNLDLHDGLYLKKILSKGIHLRSSSTACQVTGHAELRKTVSKTKYTKCKGAVQNGPLTSNVAYGFFWLLNPRM